MGNSHGAHPRRATVVRRATLMAEGNDGHREEPSSLPAQGVNGEATKFLNRVNTYTTTQKADQQRLNTLRISLAQESANQQVQAAHQAAAKLMNNTRFDQLWFLYRGLIHYIEPDGTMQLFTPQNQEAGVPAIDFALDVGDGWVFWIMQQDELHSLMYTKTDGSAGAQPIMESSDRKYLSVAVDPINNRVYLLDSLGTIWGQDYDAGNRFVVVANIEGLLKDGLWQLAIDPAGQQLYWTNDMSIWSSTTMGTDVKMVVPNHEAPFPIDLAVDHDSGKLYWIDKELRMVRRADLDGSHPEDLYQVQNPVRGLTLDYVTPEMRDVLKQEIYWVNREEQITPQTPGIVGTWPLDEGQGHVLHNTLIPLQDLPLGIRREFDDLPNNLSYPAFAYALNGRDFGMVPDRFTRGLSNSSFTIEFWVNPARIDTNDQGFFSNTTYSSNQCLHLLIRSKKAYFGFYGNDTAGTTELATDTWTHLAFRYTYDAASQTGEQAIFVNGELDGSSSGKAPYQMADGDHLWMGKYVQSFYQGLIADVRILLAPLSQAAIRETMRVHKEADLMESIVAQPRWNTLASPPTIVPKQAVLQFDGLSGYQGMGTLGDLDLTGGSFTLEQWVMPLGVDAVPNMTVLGTQEATNSSGLLLGIENQKPYAYLGSHRINSHTALPVNQWSHLAFRYDQAAQRPDLFVNGAQVTDGESESVMDMDLTYTFQQGQPLPGNMQIDRNTGWGTNGPQVAVKNDALNYSLQSLTQRNQWTMVTIPQDFPGNQGYTLTFQVQANTLQGSEVKFTLAGDVILRFTSGGTVARYQWWNGSFHTIANSNIRADGQWHTIVLQYNSGNISIQEDGVVLPSWNRTAPQTLHPVFHMQVLDVGSALDFNLGTIELQSPTRTVESTIPVITANPLSEGNPLYLGRYQNTATFRGAMSDLRIWHVARTNNELAANFRHYRETYALRGAVDGSMVPEHLFEAPSEGSLNLVSRYEIAYEQRLAAVRQKQENQAIANAQIQDAHVEKDQAIAAQTDALNRTQTEQAAHIDAKRAEQTEDRVANQNTYAHAQNDAARQVQNAVDQAAANRATAQNQAAAIRNQGKTDADTMKRNARNQRDAAQADVNDKRSQL